MCIYKTLNKNLNWYTKIKTYYPRNGEEKKEEEKMKRDEQIGLQVIIPKKTKKVICIMFKVS